jgi:hypothetical protein
MYAYLFKVSLILDFQIKNLYVFLTTHVHSTCPANLSLFDFITLAMSDEEYKLWSPYYVIFSILLSLPLSWAKYFPQHPVLKRH